MLDIRLDDEKEHKLQRELDFAWESALVWEGVGEKEIAEHYLTQACEKESELIAFRRWRIDQLIDWS